MERNTVFGTLLVSVGAGMALMYFLDPNRGAKRRAMIGDQIYSAAHKLPDAVDVTARDLSNRAYGIWAETTRMFSTDNPTDQVVEARVRSKMGRVVSHPSAINVASQNGTVTLDGVILTDEVSALLSCVENVRGVKTVKNNLQEHSSPEGIPALQGGSDRRQVSEFMQENWSPAARLLAGVFGIGLSALGATIVARSVTNIETKRLLGTGGGRRAITVEKSINVNAPLDVVYGLWFNFENFPRFMKNVLEVRKINEGISHWKVVGPAGVPVEWDAEITRVVPNELISWKSVEGSTVANAGYVLFEPNDDDSTEVTVRISYNPPAGAVGHAVATIFGADPKSEMDSDLVRMKTLLETGSAPRDAAQKTGETTRTKTAGS